MRKFIVLLTMFSCAKQATIDELEGSYDVDGLQVRCTYYICDSNKIKSTLNINLLSEGKNKKIDISIVENKRKIAYFHLDEIEINKSYIIMSQNDSYAKFNRQTKTFECYVGNNFNKRILTDTASNYYYLKGLKQ